MNVLPTSRERFIEAYEHARELDARIPAPSDSDGFEFERPIYLLHTSGRAGCIISEQTNEIASLFSTEKGQGKIVVQTAIAWGGTWLYAWRKDTRLIEYYESLNFKKWRDIPCWHDPRFFCMTYLSLPGFEYDIRVKLEDGGCRQIAA